ncbi:retrovirus-related pol polyprotein from transposon TNT 1-94 [Tanacetum coccineum]
MKNETVCKQNGSTVFLKEREHYHEIQDLKAQLQDKNIAISELKKLIEKMKGKTMDTKFDKPPVVRQPNALRIPKLSVLGKPTPFSDSLERKRFLETKSITKTNVSKGLSKPVTTHILPQTAKQAIVKLILFIVDSGCTKHMTDNLKKYNDQKGFYVKGLNHNLFSVGQFCDADLEVVFQKSTCFVKDLQGNDLLTGNRGSDLYTISLQDTSSLTLICFMAKALATQAWLWHQRLSHLNFDTINLLSKKDIVIGLPKLKYVKDQLCSSCELGKAKRSTFKTKIVPSSKGRLNLLHIDLCGLMRIESINGKKYILVITLHPYFKEEGIENQTSTPRTPDRNVIVERQNRTLVEAAQMMLLASKLPLFFWAEAIATASYTQNRSLIIPRHEKTPYHIINGIKPSLKHLHIFGCTCYITRDGENLDMMKEKGDSCILVGYSTQSKGYRVYNKRTRLIVESIHINYDEIKELSKALDYDNSGPVPPLQKNLEHNRSELESHDHNNEPLSSKLVPNVSPLADKTDSSLQELYFLFSPLYDEFFTAELITLTTTFHVEENNDNQAEDARFEPYEFINPFCTPVQEVAESSSRNVENSNMHTFYQHHQSKHRWTIDHQLEQVHGNLSKPMQTRRQLATVPEMCMFALTVSTIEPTNIKEAIADHAWIEAMQEELHQFDRLKVWELVDKPFGKTVIKLKWLWNKKDEDNTVIRKRHDS